MVKVATREALKLFHEGMVTLAKMEQNGILIDEDYLQRAMKKTSWRIKRLDEKIRSYDAAKVWKRRFGNRTKFTANNQLETVIFDELGFERSGRVTETGKHKSDKYAFEKVDHPIVKDFFERAELDKALGTYLKGIAKETMYGYLHAFFNLQTTITYRSSSDKINFQNLPIRNERIGRIIRRCIIAPPGFRVGEIDYGGIEVCVSACYHKDPKMISYIEDPKSDMHRDMAMQCYQLKKKEVSKLTRYCAKNKFVFPEFYGSYYVDCTKSLWDAIDTLELKTESGVPLREHLASKGITERGPCIKGEKYDLKSNTLEAHIKEVEQDFWNNRFTVYAEWKKDWWQLYLKQAYFEFLTGFVAQGLYDRKQVCNSPIQGSAFHCLLWSLIELQKWIEKKKLKTKLIFEIHDSIGAYFHEKEVDYVLEQAHYIMTKKIREHWPWIIVPLTIEAEIAPSGGSWFAKEKVKIA